ncbi:hypothetical protein WICPIJ_002568 [Wickerhamomyces pijperi]|uniref:Uncharacterized protein n=1 Tax=Wickerhamomyces pijperi TaxID=599730 RepID=A0A9P8QBL5_WICPI|nr:hypothetical protein WICPIJ_002568 [Wickerhamomyces pijperi]
MVDGPFIRRHRSDYDFMDGPWRVNGDELDNFFSDQGQVTHVSKSQTCLSFVIFALLMTFNYKLGDFTTSEQINGQVSVVAHFHGPIEDLLDNVEDNVVQEVVPREMEEHVEDLDDHLVVNESNLQLITDDCLFTKNRFVLIKFQFPIGTLRIGIWLGL